MRLWIPRQGETISQGSLPSAPCLPAPPVADRLTAIADAVLAAVARLAWRDLTARHGTPAGDAGLAIIGYGTLGGGELSFGSDLDLIFLYGGAGADEATDGERPIANSTFFTRLSQRILHLLTTVTPSGRLYEVDVRLRPNGRAGLLVSSLFLRRPEHGLTEIQADDSAS